MRTSSVIAKLIAAITLMACMLPPCGCRADEPATTEPEAKKAADNLPLVDNMDDLKKLDPNSPAWIDKKHKELILVGEACKAGYPLEFFATLPDRAYEAVVVITTRPSIVHAGLLVLGAKPGHPVRFDPEFRPATGTVIAIEVRWKDDKGKVLERAGAEVGSQHADEEAVGRRLGLRRQRFVARTRATAIFRRQRRFHFRVELADGDFGLADQQHEVDGFAIVRGRPGRDAAGEDAGDDRAEAETGGEEVAAAFGSPLPPGEGQAEGNPVEILPFRSAAELRFARRLVRSVGRVDNSR